jgi:hypothetical protein
VQIGDQIGNAFPAFDSAGFYGPATLPQVPAASPALPLNVSVEINMIVEVEWSEVDWATMITQPPSSTPRHSPTQQTSGLAIASLVCGIASFVILILPAIVAIICGHSSRSRIKKSNGALRGKGLALAGLICGYGSLILITLIACLIVYNVKESNRIEAEEIAEEIRRGKEIHSLILKYETDHGKFPDTLGELIEKGYASSIDNLQPTDGENWIYFQGLTSKSSSYKYIIRSENHKVVIFVNGTSGDRNLSYTLEPTDSPMRGHEKVQE